MRPRQLPIFLTAEWRYLAMLNYQVDPSVLHRFVPPGTEIDQWNGIAFVSMVGFLFQKTRIFGLPVPIYGNFEEVNLRFYVRGKINNEWQRAVVFIKEIVPHQAIALTARALYNENYIRLPMGHELIRRCDDASETNVLRYWWGEGQENSIQVEFEGEPAAVLPSSDEEFITEHYWGYSLQKNGGSMVYRVEHPKWRIWNAKEAKLSCDVKTLYGGAFSKFLSVPPASAFLAEGSAVTVSRGEHLRPGV